MTPSIPCGLRFSREQPGFLPEEKWDFSRTTDLTNRKQQAIALHLQRVFFTVPKRSLVLKLSHFGPFCTALSHLGFLSVTRLPPSIRKANGPSFLNTLESLCQSN